MAGEKLGNARPSQLPPANLVDFGLFDFIIPPQRACSTPAEKTYFLLFCFINGLFIWKMEIHVTRTSPVLSEFDVN